MSSVTTSLLGMAVWMWEMWEMQIFARIFCKYFQYALICTENIGAWPSLVPTVHLFISQRRAPT